jgi:hypothetical protein
VHPLAIAGATFACTFGAAMAGLLLSTRLPRHHLDGDSRDVIKLVMGLIATLSALVLGLLIAAGHSSFESQNGDLQRLSAGIVELDRDLGFYGAETLGIRAALRAAVAGVHDRVWMPGGAAADDLDPERGRDQSARLIAAIERLQPQTETQRFAKAEAIRVSAEVGRTRQLMFNKIESSIPWPFIVVLIFWLSALFLGFGLFARRHATIVATLLIGAASVSAAMLLIIDLDQPYSGIVRLSDVPLRNALSQIGADAAP